MSIRIGVAASVASPIMAESWRATLSSDSPTPSPSSFRVGKGRIFGSAEKAGGVASSGLERGLVRVRVRVTLDDGGHRYSQREQLMSDHSHDQLTVPDDLHDERIGATPPANSDGRHETDERIRSEDPFLATDRLSQHTHLQPVALGVTRC